MAVSPILFLDDRNHISVTTSSLTASNTATGYAVDNAREANLVTAWKPTDSATDEYLQLDGGSAGWLGAAGETGWWCVAYDARGSGQASIDLHSDDNSGFASATWHSAITMGSDEVACAYGSFTIPTPAERYYRLSQTVAVRTGTVPAKILYWGMFGQSGVVRIGSTGYAQDAPGPYQIGSLDRYGLTRTSGGVVFSNRYAKPGQAFSISLEPATLTMFEALRDKLFSTGGAGRAYFVQQEGLRNPDGTADFFLCRMTSPMRVSQVSYVDTYFTQLDFETCAWL